MPKITVPSFPLSGLFGISKPSGPTSMSIINDVKLLIGQSRVFVDAEKVGKVQVQKVKRRKYAQEGVKIGQGGTLDPLADGVLVVGVGKGTKRLSEFLDCTKEYYTTCLLGCETNTYDSEGVRVRVAPWQHVTREKVQSALAQFSGEIQQKPPIFSALKMDGMPLYEYARKGIPLPRPIESRKVQVYSLELVEWKGTDHSYRWPEQTISVKEKQAMENALRGAEGDAAVEDDLDPAATGSIPTAFVLKMKVSGGTYVRSIVHDLAHTLGSAGHVVTLTRSRQGRFTLEPAEEGDIGCISWEVFRKASTSPGDVDEEGLTEWEREVVSKLDVVGGNK